MHDWDPYGFQLSNRDICIFTQMEASCKNNSQSLFFLDSFVLGNHFYPNLEQCET